MKRQADQFRAGPPSSLASDHRILLVTDNRFWLNKIGSNARILAIVEHLLRSGSHLRVAFLGRLYEHDRALILFQGLDVQASLGMATATADDAGVDASAQPDVEARFRHFAKNVVRLFRAAVTQIARPRPAGGNPTWWREVTLRAHEKSVRDGYDARHALLIRSLMVQQQTTTLIVEYVHLAWVVDHLDEANETHVFRVIDTHDVQHQRQMRFHAADQYHPLDITRTEEAQWLRRFNVILAIQDRDAEHFRAMAPGSKVLTVVHPQPIRPSQAKATAELVVGFVGSNMAPNRLAAEELVYTIWPRVASSAALSARLHVVGAVCESLKEDSLPSGVTLLGTVDDLDAAYAAMDVVVNLVRIGGGLKIKCVDALCRGKALVTTSVGGEGLEDGAGTAFVVADDPEDFARAVCSLIDHESRRVQLGQRALQYARGRFDPAHAFDHLDSILR